MRWLLWPFGVVLYAVVFAVLLVTGAARLICGFPVRLPASE